MDIVQVTDLKKTFGQVTAVDGISFTLKRGEIFGLLGPNGAGKTTTIKLLVGLARPTAGRIKIKGLSAEEKLKQIQRFLGVVPDANNLYPELNGFENLCFCAALYGLGKTERERRAAKLLEQFGLTAAARRPFGTYSRGMQRRLTIAAGLIHDPEILFLDEPTTGIDVESARRIRDLIAGLKKAGKTILLTTHYLEEAERLCDRIAFLVGGKIVKTDTVDRFMAAAGGQGRIRLILAGDADLDTILSYLSQQEVTVLEAGELKPSLEEIFVQITGAAKGGSER